MTLPLAVDLCCGKGGWARGLLDAGFSSVLGIDIDPSFAAVYPGTFVPGDVLDIARMVSDRDGDWYKRIKKAKIIVASPPCQEFSRHDMPWTRRLNPPPPDISIALAVWEIRRVTGVPTIIENVRGSMKWLEPHLGRARRCGSFYLYGDVPVLLPKMQPGEVVAKERMPHKPADRAMIPYPLARWIGEVFVR